ncbi:AAA family ATPase [Streptomyces rugosispiralis]|uniref:MoxR family ATPase n=1 Tax=Streptomyces rugosispiralis TaxID=2967341 RepID=A0ABT1UZE6_9ACTN|nr:MoxR family ATPase [Streptomyces rugosispiralis]MCQ8190168.1 MoxR family ATPase [Streptomyces rugosispiralis]
MLTYDKEFAPISDGVTTPTDGSGYPTDDEVYVFDDDRLVLAVNVALKTGRPLLLFGPPGSGKSSLAPNVGRIMGWNRYTHVVTARTEPEDLLWRFDALKRLNDAQAHQLDPDVSRYYAKGPLWRAFEEGGTRRSVVLIDEIDKADPDLPNSLLGPLGSLSFPCPWDDERQVTVSESEAPLVVITTNDERELPRPFLRRCIVFELRPPDREHLLRVARGHLGTHYEEALAGYVADQVFDVRAKLEGSGPGPSTAEYLDALKASQRLGVVPGTPEWAVLEDVTLQKRRAPHRRRDGVERNT